MNNKIIIMSEKRIKVSENFYLDEFIHPVIYKRFGAESKRYLNMQLVQLVQAIRTNYGKPIYINTWFNGGRFKNSGLRDYLNPHKKNSRSRHYYGLCGDLHTEDIKELQQHVYLNREMYRIRYGLTVLEDFKYTEGWLHVSIEWTGLIGVQIIKP